MSPADRSNSGSAWPLACELKTLDAREPLDARLIDKTAFDEFLRTGVLPWRERDGRVLLAALDPTAARAEIERAGTPESYDIAAATGQELLDAAQEALREEFVAEAAYGLSERSPELSARRGITLGQAAAMLAVAVATGVSFYRWPEASFVAASLVSGAFFLAIMLFRLVLMIASLTAPRRKRQPAPSPAELPIYTILVALKDEAALASQITRALSDLDYPAAKLDILLLLEESDTRTRHALRQLDLDGRFRIVTVPDRWPRTKPKACNYGLAFARGEFVALYDAEDRPDPRQLLRAIEEFRAHPDTDCVQAKLGFYNVAENWLTRQFAIEFSLWFFFLLPGLARLGLPVPLGGTSNHFRRETLEKMGGWDAFNVTEDADIGIRLARRGGKVRIIDSITAEEANCELGNWLHQRSRWLKGYMQTWFVHMRAPGRLYAELGGPGFWSFQLIIGGAVASAFLHLVFWSILFARFAGLAVEGANLPSFLWPWIALVLIAGNALAILFGLIAAMHPQFKRQGRLSLALAAISVPLYWFLISFAAIKALFSFALRPFYWAKTRHAISRFSRNIR